MPLDLAPEKIVAQTAAAAGLTLEQAAMKEDVGAQPGPEDFASDVARGAAAADLSRVTWPSDDSQAPDYAYLASEPAPPTFTLTPSVLETLITLNRYSPYRDKETIGFALRGAQLRQGHEVEMSDKVELENVRPDHRHFRCVIGFYFTGSQTLSAYTASTVPCRLAIWGYKNGGQSSNMLPTGLHTFYVWRHKEIRPALRMGQSKEDPETGAPVTVLRNNNNYMLDTTDVFDLNTPYDNVHCSYYLDEDGRIGAQFSSWGCLTIRGEKTPSEQWKRFQAVLNRLGARERVDLLLATGKDAAVVAAKQQDISILAPKMTALRSGSRGPEVERLQAKISVPVTGFFGAETLDRFTGEQRKLNETAGAGRVADGVYSMAMDAATGWQVFQAGA